MSCRSLIAWHVTTSRAGIADKIWGGTHIRILQYGCRVFLPHATCHMVRQHQGLAPGGRPSSWLESFDSLSRIRFAGCTAKTKKLATNLFHHAGDIAQDVKPYAKSLQQFTTCHHVLLVSFYDLNAGCTRHVWSRTWNFGEHKFRCSSYITFGCHFLHHWRRTPHTGMDMVCTIPNIGHQSLV